MVLLTTTMADPGSLIVEFGEFRLDPRTGELWNRSQRLVLAEQPLRILLMLTARAGALVTRDELRTALWGSDTFVDFEHGLNAAIKRLREVLGDSAATPQFIETIPRRGYRFVAPVTLSGASITRDIVERAPSPRASTTVPQVEVTPPPGVRQGHWMIAGLAVIVFATGVVEIRRMLAGADTSYADAPGRLVRLTATAGLNVNPALSPDGSLVAYASDRAGAGAFDIWVQRTGTETPVQITSSAGDETEPSFSPDGGHIVFTQSDGIYIVGALGGTARRVTEVARPHTPRFSPDGRWIAYWTGRPIGITRAAGASGQAFIVSSDGGTPRAFLPAFASVRHPIWSSDGQRLLFIGGRDVSERGVDWYVARADGSEAAKTTAYDSLDAMGAASLQDPPIPTAWGRDGAVLTETTANDRSNVWQLTLSPSTGQLVGVPRRLTFGTAIERHPAIAATGRIAFSSLVENVDIWRVPLDDATGVASAPPERVTDNPATDVVNNVSRDGRVLAFRSSRTQQDEIWLKDLDSGRERQLTFSGAIAGEVSPDGSLVLVWRRQAIEIVRVSDGRASTLCTDCARSFGWSSDGSRVLLARNKPSRLFVHDVRSGGESELARHSSWFLRQGRFSPDDRWVTFYTTNTPDLRQIFVVPSVAGGPIPQAAWVSVVTGFGTQPAWAPDGRSIYYMSEEDGMQCVWMQRVDPVTKRPLGAPRVVQHFHQPRLRAGTGAIATTWVHDRFFYVTLSETTGNIWVLDPAA